MSQINSKWNDDFYSGIQYPVVPPEWPRQVKKKIARPKLPPGIPMAQNDIPIFPSWIGEQRAKPELYECPGEVIARIGSFCLSPHDLLCLSSTCRRLAVSYRTVECWLDHHWGHGYDINILRRKAQRAAASPEHKYGSTGWGLLVESARDKWEFVDPGHQYQAQIGKPIPHNDYYIRWVMEGELGPNPNSLCQKRGEYWIETFYNVITEHECRNLMLFPYLYDDALALRVVSPRHKYLQTLIAAAHLLNGQWQYPYGICTTKESLGYVYDRLAELRDHADKPKSTFPTLAIALLSAVSMMQVDDFLTTRRLYPHPPLGPNMWWDEEGNIDPKGVSWAPKVQKQWKGTLDLLGQFCVVPLTNRSGWEFPPHRLAPVATRMRVDFGPDGNIVGRGSDFGGKFLITGNYSKNYVKMRKEYIEGDMEDQDVYIAIGQILPWGMYGRWKLEDEDREPQRCGYWGMWIFEGAPQITTSYTDEINGNYIQWVPAPYKVNPNWYDEYEAIYDRGPIRWVDYQRHLPGALPNDIIDVNFDDIETEYETDTEDANGKVVRGKKKPKYKVVVVK